MSISVTQLADCVADLLYLHTGSELDTVCDSFRLGKTGLVATDSKKKYVRARVRATKAEEHLGLIRRLIAEYQHYYDGIPADQRSNHQPALAYEVLVGLCPNDTLRPVPRNLVFASVGKPDLVFTDVTLGLVDDIGDRAVVYRDVKPDGVLTIGELTRWWEATGREGRLSERMRQSCGSETEKKVFEHYYKRAARAAGIVYDDSPALLPQVWLHYDPLTLKGRRGVRVLDTQRMDFMMLLSTGPVIIEVDGPTHHESKEAFAATLRATRNLTFLGFQVFRFGVHELDQRGWEGALDEFFGRLLQQHTRRSITERCR